MIQDELERDVLGWGLIGESLPRSIETRLFRLRDHQHIAAALLITGAWEGKSTPLAVAGILRSADIWVRSSCAQLIALAEGALFLHQPDFASFVETARRRILIEATEDYLLELDRTSPDRAAYLLEKLNVEEKHWQAAREIAHQSPSSRSAVPAGRDAHVHGALEIRAASHAG